MSSTEVEKYSSGFVFSQHSELQEVSDPENYLEEVKDARRIQKQSIEYNQKVASQPLSSNSREAWARRNNARKAVKEAKKATKQINKMETEVKEQVAARRTYLEAQKAQEKQVYVEAAKKKEEEIQFLIKKEAWLSPTGRAPRIGMIEQGISLGYLPESERSWVNRMKALEAPFLHRRTDLPNWKRGQLEGFYQGMTQKQWDVSRAQDLRNQAASQRQSASIKAGAAIEAAGGTLGGKYTAKSADGSLMGSDLRATSTDPKIAAANQAQSAYVAQLRAGGIGLAQALLKPQTDQSYIVKGQQATKDQTSINLETFLTERGYDISKPETIPDSIFKAPVKYTSARKQTSEPIMGDLRDKIPASPLITKAELAQRSAIQKKFAIPESPPEIVITKTETKTTPSTLQPVSAQILAQQDSKLPPGFESGEAIPLINYDKGLAGGFFGYTAELYTSVSNMFKPEGQQKYAQPSLESAFVDETISTFGTTAKGEMPDLTKSGQTMQLIQEKDIGWVVGSVAATVALGAATFGAQKVYPFIKGLYKQRKIMGGWYDKQVNQLAKSLYPEPTPTTGKISNVLKLDDFELPKEPVKYGVLKNLKTGKYVIEAGTELKPEKIPAWIITPGKKGTGEGFSLPSTLTPEQQLTKLTVIGKPGKTYANIRSIGKFTHEIPVEKGNVITLKNPFTTKSQIEVSGKTGQRFREVKDFEKKKKITYTKPIEKLLKTEFIPVATQTKVSLKNLEQYPKLHKASIENPQIVMSERSLITEGKITKADRFKKKAVIRQTPKTFEMIDPKTGKKIATTKKDVTTQKRGADIVNPETGEKITTSMNIPDTKLTSTLTDLTSMKSPQVLKTEKAVSGSGKKIKATVREMAGQNTPTFTMETGTVSAVLGTSITSTTKAQGTAPATLTSTPQTISFMGSQTTTTSTTIPLSRNLIMSTPTIQKDKASISIREIAGEIASVREKQGIKSATIPITKTIARQQLSTPQKTGTRLSLVPGLKWKVQTKTKLALVPALKQTTVIPPPVPNKTRPAVAPIYIPNTLKTKTKEKKRKKKRKSDFIGNVSESSILGVYKRKELTYGKKRVLKLSAKDKRLQASAKNRLQFLKESDIVKKRKKKSNTQTVLGFSQPKQKKLTKKEKKSKVVRF